MLRLALLAFAMTGALTLHATAQDNDVEQFISFQAGLYLDDKCGFLKQFERAQSYNVEMDLKNELPFEGAYQAEKIDEAQYHAELDPLMARGKAIADAIECTNQQEAAKYIVPLRDQFSRIIFADLIIAVQAGNLNAEQSQAARAYEGMIAPLYGQNWTSFVQYAQGLAQLKVDENRKLDADMNPFANQSLLGAFNYGNNYEDDYFSDPTSTYATTMYFDSMVNGTINNVDSILFEMIAEQFGLRYRTLRSPSATNFAYALIDAQGNRIAHILQDPARYDLLEGGSPVPAVFTIQPDGSLRVMTFGAEAAQMQNGSVTVLINPNALPAGQAVDYDYTRSQAWQDAALVFKAERTSEPCLGGPCFSLPAEALTALKGGSAGQNFFFLFSTLPDPEIPARDNAAFETGYTYFLGAWLGYMTETAQ